MGRKTNGKPPPFRRRGLPRTLTKIKFPTSRVWLSFGVLLLAVLSLPIKGQSVSSVSTRPAFTIGKDTTLVDGPLNVDGTVNYMGAINALLSKGVTKENNAAIPLLKADANNEFERVKLVGICEELGIPVPVKEVGLIQSLNLFAREQNGGKQTEELTAQVDGWDRAMIAKPWKGTEMPVVEAWIKGGEKGYGLIEEACRRDRFYVPLVSAKTPPTFMDSMPPLAFIRQAGMMLAARGMLRAGSGDLQGTLEDLRRERVLGRLIVQEHEMIAHLVGNALERDTMRSFQGLVVNGNLTAAQLEQVTKEINALPPFPGIDTTTNSVEELLTFDAVMQCIRGDGEKVMRMQAVEFDETKHVDLGDLPKVDWDILMKELHRTNVQASKNDQGLTFAQVMADYDTRTKRAAAEKMPGEALFGDTEQPTGIPAVEAFLKTRQDESREAFSKRIGGWLGDGDPGASKRFEMVIERCHVDRGLALLAVSLAEYHLVHGEYPAALKDLGAGPVLQDPFSGKEMVYRRQGKGYLVYSLGLNLKDDQGEGDDIAVKTEK